LKHSASDIERIADHANNLAELAERKLKKNLSFSEDAQNELTTLTEKTKLIYEKALTALQGENKEDVNTIN
jgi:phosphate:Na+ symporter